MAADAPTTGLLKPSPTGGGPCATAWALLRLCRLYYGLPLGFTLGLTIVYALDGRMSGHWTATLVASISLSLVVAAGYVFNDVCDARCDRINAPSRPIVAGEVLAGIALLWAVGLWTTGLTIGGLLCRPGFALGLAAVAVGLAGYDLVSKRLGIGKQLLVAALMTSIYPLAVAQAGGASGVRAPTLWFFPVWLFLTSFGYEILKDIRDRHGDSAGARPVSGSVGWIARNPARARRIAAAVVLAGAAVLIAPAFAGCGEVYISIIPAAILAAAMSTALPLRPALGAIYLECVLVGIAATADLL